MTNPIWGPGTTNKALGVILASAAFAGILAGCAEPLPEVLGSKSNFQQSLYDVADPVHGGLLYDKWWTAKNQNVPPSGTHPLWNQSQAASNGDAWRCTECHGWDYSGNNSVVGLLDARNQSAEALFDYFRTSDHHGYGDKLNSSDIYDLIQFIKGGAKDGVETITPPPSTVGARAAGQLIYTNKSGNEQSCNDCHGNDGKAIDLVDDNLNTVPNEFIFDVARDEPEEFFHKVRFGHPGSQMRRGVTYDKQLTLAIADVRNLYAYVSEMDNGGNGIPPDGAFDQTKFFQANEIRGGKLYDKWWAEKGTPAPTGDHPLWATRAKDGAGAPINSRSGSETWRCEECHGWDYRGAAGEYDSSNGHYTGFSGILEPSSIARDQADEIFAFLATDPDHQYVNNGTPLLNDDDLYDLTRFIWKRRDDPAGAANLVDNATNQGEGKAASGEALYGGTGTSASSCSTCHGADGKTIDFEDGVANTAPNEFVDTVAKDDAWEFMHKVRFGQPGEPTMPAMASSLSKDATQVLFDALDVLEYAQTWLAPDVKRGGRLYDHWMLERGIELSQQPNNFQPMLSSGTDPETDSPIAVVETWRCSTCHGWEYKGRGSMSTLLNADRLTREEIFDQIQNGSVDHRFGHPLSAGLNPISGLTDTDIADLSRFILDEVTPTEKGVANAIGLGEATAGSVLYTSPDAGGDCIGCHGAQDAMLLQHATDEPEEFIHKTRFGNPATEMIPGTEGYQGLSLAHSADVLAYVLSWSGSGSAPGYDTADIAKGGRLFDNWWEEKKVGAPLAANPFWASRYTTIPDLAPGKEIDTWRCTTCHRWDYRGVGFYRDDTGRIRSADDLSSISTRYPLLTNEQLQQHVFDWIKGNKSSNLQHAFGVTRSELPAVLSDQDIWDLTKFILGGGVINTDEYYSLATRDIKVTEITGTNGKTPLQIAVENGGMLYQGNKISDVNCESCHGPSGIDLPPLATTAPDIFLLANDKPLEFFHKVRFGQPATAMQSIYGSTFVDLGAPISLNSEARDILGYARDQFKKRSP